MPALLIALHELDTQTRWEFFLTKVVAIDPNKPGVIMQVSHGRTHSGITNYVVVYGDYEQEHWRIRIKAWTLDEAITLANVRLQKIPDEQLTAKPRVKGA